MQNKGAVDLLKNHVFHQGRPAFEPSSRRISQPIGSRLGDIVYIVTLEAELGWAIRDGFGTAVL